MNTREKLTEIIGNVVVNDKGNRIRDVFHPEFVEKIVDALVSTEAYRSLPKPTEWISVEDALPEVGEDVLLYSKEDDKIDIGHYSNMFCRFFLRKFEDGNVTHWMPLPDAPKGE